MKSCNGMDLLWSTPPAWGPSIATQAMGSISGVNGFAPKEISAPHNPSKDKWIQKWVILCQVVWTLSNTSNDISRNCIAYQNEKKKSTWFDLACQCQSCYLINLNSKSQWLFPLGVPEGFGNSRSIRWHGGGNGIENRSNLNDNVGRRGRRTDVMNHNKQTCKKIIFKKNSTHLSNRWAFSYFDYRLVSDVASRLRRKLCVVVSSFCES